MRHALLRLVAVAIFTVTCTSCCTLAAELPAGASVAQAKGESFTGKIRGKQVRMRLEPSTDSQILHELTTGDLVIVTGMQNDFYSIRPPKGMKAFVYRTYIIDDVVEGNRVNVRSAPDLDAPVIAQLNKGDHIEGHVSPLNNKWLQIQLPEPIRFYVASEFIEKVGDANMLARAEQRQQQATKDVDAAQTACQDELCRAYLDIDIETATDGLRRVIRDYADVPDEQQRAAKFLASAEENYNRKKIEHLESQALAASHAWHTRCQELADHMCAQHEHLEALERSLHARNADMIPPCPPVNEIPIEVSKPKQPIAKDKLTEGMTVWLPQEGVAYETWVKTHPDDTMERFYEEQAEGAMRLKGSIQPYRRSVKNRPGNYLLMDQIDEIPIGFLYSTKVNMDKWVGKQVMLLVAPRPNNNFAFPAYFVLNVEPAIE